jgi:hypothetical protein
VAATATPSPATPPAAPAATPDKATGAEAAQAAKALPKPKPKPRPAAAPMAAAPAQHPAAHAAGTAPAAAAAAAPVKDRWAQMLDTIATQCGKETFLNKVICEQKVRIQYCDGYWGKAPQCPMGMRDPDRTS